MTELNLTEEGKIFRYNNCRKGVINNVTKQFSIIKQSRGEIWIKNKQSD